MSSASTVATLRAHASDESIPVAACERLVLLSERSRRLKAAARAGALDAVLTAMNVHPGSLDVQANGCNALAAMCNDDDEDGVARKQRAGRVLEHVCGAF